MSRRSTSTEGDGGDFLDPRHRDQHQWNQQGQSQDQGEGRPENEVMAGPIGEYGRDPGADAVCRGRQHQRLHRRGPVEPKDRQRQQDADQNGDDGEFPVIRVNDRPGPGKFRFPLRIENAPIGADAAFEELPGLVDRFYDIVFHANRIGAGNKVTQYNRLLKRARIGISQIVTGARPAEFGDHNPLARKLVAQQLVTIDGLIDGLLVREVFPVGQDVRGDEVDRRRKFRIVAPDIPDFTSRNRDIDGFFNFFDKLDQPLDLLIAAIDRLVADDHAVHIAVVPRQTDCGFDLALVALDVLVDPGADGDLEPEFRCDRRHQFVAFGRRIQAQRPRQGGEFL